MFALGMKLEAGWEHEQHKQEMECKMWSIENPGPEEKGSKTGNHPLFSLVSHNQEKCWLKN